MFEELNERRKAGERNIAKGFSIDDVDLDLEKALEDEFEKARVKKTFAIGDTFTRHGITYRCTGISANTGRPTWSKVKDGQSGKQEQLEKKEEKKDEQPKQEQKKRYLLNPNGTPVDMSKETDENLSFTRTLIKQNIKEYKDKLDKLSPGAKKSRQIVTEDIQKQEGMLAEVEEEIERRKKQATQQSKKSAKEETKEEQKSNKIFQPTEDDIKVTKTKLKEYIRNIDNDNIFSFNTNETVSLKQERVDTFSDELKSSKYCKVSMQLARLNDKAVSKVIKELEKKFKVAYYKSASQSYQYQDNLVIYIKPLDSSNV